MADVRSELRSAAPSLVGAVEELCRDWLQPAVERLQREGLSPFPKTLNDAVWGTIELLPCEVLLLDSPLLQRLRGIRQLGMAYLVYPGAGHNRLEHSCGVVEAAEQIFLSLTRNAKNRTKYGGESDFSIPSPSDRDHAAIRLGALLHDVGHAPFSHVTEHLIATQYESEFDAANEVLRGAFEGTTGILPAEQMSALIVLSDSMRRLLEHARFDACPKRDQLAEAIAARILGSRAYLDATYLSGVISGPLDADKIDYMARDGHHAGLPLGLDLTRLVSKLEVVTVTPQNALNPELKERADAHPQKRFYDLGISRAGLGAYEQMVIARVTLYDRLYYHHKVRAAEGMVDNLIETVAASGPIVLRELFKGHTDDAMVEIWGGRLASSDVRSGGPVATDLASRIRARELFHRAYSFSSRFIAGLEGLPDQDRRDTKALHWSAVTGALEDHAGRRELATAIADKARALAAAVDGFRDLADLVTPAEIVVDLPSHKRVAKGGAILTASERGRVGTPNLFFNAEKWVDAYTQQKHNGHVFAPRRLVPLVALASRIVFYERFGLVMGEEADVVAKTSGIIDDSTYDELARQNVCSAECVAMLREPRPRLVRLTVDDLHIPDALAREDPELAIRLVRELVAALPVGLPAAVHGTLAKSIGAMLVVLQTIEQAGTYVKHERPDETRELQPHIRDLLRAQRIKVEEGAAYGGGETDLVLSDVIVLENKVLGSVEDPFSCLEPAAWQVRRYSIAISQRVRFVVAAYRPPSEGALRPLPQRVRARAAVGGDGIEVQFVVPYGHDVPSHVAPRRPPG